MMVVAWGIIPTREQDFIMGRGEKNCGEESRCCDAIFGTRIHITNVNVEVLHIILTTRGGGR